MVASKITKEVIFEEVKTVDPEDVGHLSSLYSLDTYDEHHSIAVLLGKPKYKFSEKGVVYIPIYAIGGDSLHSERMRIGVFELATREITGAFVDGEADLDRLSSPIFFSFATKEYFDGLESHPTILLEQIEKTEAREKMETAAAAAADTVAEVEADEDDQFSLKVKKEDMPPQKQAILDKIEKGIFDVDEKFNHPDELIEETETLAKEYKTEFKESARNNWVMNFMKNQNYDVIENEGAGDCFFAVVRDAYKSIGKTTTVSKLRALLANEMTDEVYQSNRKLFLEFETQIKEYKKEIAHIKKTLAAYKKRVDETTQKTEEVEKIIKEAKAMKEKQKEKEEKASETEKWQKEYVGYMRTVDSLEKMREFMQTSSYWADTWTISTLERLLNMKMVIFSEQAYGDGSLDSVMNCGEANRKLQDAGTFSPDYYIMTSYTGNHYRLITYKKRAIFKFKEVPYDVKILVLQKCVEKNAGIYYLIQDFRKLKTKFGIDEDEGKPREFEDEVGYGDLYDSETVFVYYNLAEKKAKPGAANGEKMAAGKLIEFLPLSKIEEWRKKLDDKWEGLSLQIDGHKWYSVEHYVQGAKYKKGYPDVYLQFSLDSGTELSRDVKKVKGAKLKTDDGKAPKIDTDYPLGRDVEERVIALDAKFKENEDMKTILKMTKNALLLKRDYKGAPAQPDMDMMKLRSRL